MVSTYKGTVTIDDERGTIVVRPFRQSGELRISGLPVPIPSIEKQALVIVHMEGQSWKGTCQHD